MTDSTANASEPSMEDILASIRRIIDEEDSREREEAPVVAAPRRPAVAPRPPERTAKLFSISGDRGRRDAPRAEEPTGEDEQIFPERESDHWSRATGRGEEEAPARSERDIFERAQSKLEAAQSAARQKVDELASFGKDETPDEEEAFDLVDRVTDPADGDGSIGAASESVEDTIAAFVDADDRLEPQEDSLERSIAGAMEDDSVEDPVAGSIAESIGSAEDDVYELTATVEDTPEAVDAFAETGEETSSVEEDASDEAFAAAADSANSIFGRRELSATELEAGLSGEDAGEEVSADDDAPEAIGEDRAGELAEAAEGPIDELQDDELLAVFDSPADATPVMPALEDSAPEPEAFVAEEAADAVEAEVEVEVEAEAEHEEPAPWLEDDETAALDDSTEPAGFVASTEENAPFAPLEETASEIEDAVEAVADEQDHVPEADFASETPEAETPETDAQPHAFFADASEPEAPQEESQESGAEMDEPLGDPLESPFGYADRYRAEDVYQDIPPDLGGDYRDSLDAEPDTIAAAAIGVAAATAAREDDLDKVGGMVRDALDEPSRRGNPPVEEEAMARKAYAEPDPSTLVSMTSEEISARALASLSDPEAEASRRVYGALKITEDRNSDSIEGVVRDMLRPMLREWLDDNLPTMVEGMVRAEVERISARARRYQRDPDA